VFFRLDFIDYRVVCRQHFNLPARYGSAGHRQTHSDVSQPCRISGTEGVPLVCEFQRVFPFTVANKFLVKLRTVGRAGKRPDPFYAVEHFRVVVNRLGMAVPLPAEKAYFNLLLKLGKIPL
jgi:hypothetical protein